MSFFNKVLASLAPLKISNFEELIQSQPAGYIPSMLISILRLIDKEVLEKVSDLLLDKPGYLENLSSTMARE